MYLLFNKIYELLEKNTKSKFYLLTVLYLNSAVKRHTNQNFFIDLDAELYD